MLVYSSPEACSTEQALASALNTNFCERSLYWTGLRTILIWYTSLHVGLTLQHILKSVYIGWRLRTHYNIQVWGYTLIDSQTSELYNNEKGRLYTRTQQNSNTTWQAAYMYLVNLMKWLWINDARQHSKNSVDVYL